MIRLTAESVGIKRNYPFHVFLNAIFWRKSLFEENKTTHKKAGSTREPTHGLKL